MGTLRDECEGAGVSSIILALYEVYFEVPFLRRPTNASFVDPNRVFYVARNCVNLAAGAVTAITLLSTVSKQYSPGPCLFLRTTLRQETRKNEKKKRTKGFE